MHAQKWVRHKMDLIEIYIRFPSHTFVNETSFHYIDISFTINVIGMFIVSWDIVIRYCWNFSKTNNATGRISLISLSITFGYIHHIFSGCNFITISQYNTSKEICGYVYIHTDIVMSYTMQISCDINLCVQITYIIHHFCSTVFAIVDLYICHISVTFMSILWITPIMNKDKCEAFMNI